MPVRISSWEGKRQNDPGFEKCNQTQSHFPISWSAWNHSIIMQTPETRIISRAISGVITVSCLAISKTVYQSPTRWSSTRMFPCCETSVNHSTCDARKSQRIALQNGGKRHHCKSDRSDRDCIVHSNRQKNTKELRICIDPQNLNKALMRPHHPLKMLDEVVLSISDAKIFSILDAKSAFWHIKLDEQSSYYMTFNSIYGRYRNLWRQYGISSGSEVYQRLQNILRKLQKYDFIIVYKITFVCFSQRRTFKIPIATLRGHEYRYSHFPEKQPKS